MNAERQVRVAVTGDLHFDGIAPGKLKRVFDRIAEEADVLAMVGDLTTHGSVEQVEGLVREMEGFDLPVVTVLGNHDLESDQTNETVAILRDRGIHVLDGENVVLEGVGFAGVKGFGGGFGQGALGAFGEKLYKEFVQAALDEALKLERAPDARCSPSNRAPALRSDSRNARGRAARHLPLPGILAPAVSHRIVRTSFSTGTPTSARRKGGPRPGSPSTTSQQGCSIDTPVVRTGSGPRRREIAGRIDAIGFERLASSRTR